MQITASRARAGGLGLAGVALAGAGGVTSTFYGAPRRGADGERGLTDVRIMQPDATCGVGATMAIAKNHLELMTMKVVNGSVSLGRAVVTRGRI